MNNNDKLWFALGGLVLGLLIAGFFASYAVNGNRGGMMRMMGIRYGDHMMIDGSYMVGNTYGNSSAMRAMMSGLNNKTGNDFDQAFLSEMILHHEGAVDMATSALSNAQHQELKDLAEGIINAQTKEIGQMKVWQQAWSK